MKNTMSLMSLVLLAGCNGSEVSGGVTTSGESPKTLSEVSTGGAFTVKTTHAKIIVNSNNAGTLFENDLSNSLASVGDSSNSPKRVIISFSLADLVGKNLKSGQLNIYYDNKSSAFSSLGSLKAYQIDSTGLIDVTHYNAAESVLGVITYLGISNSTQVSIDIQDALQASLDRGDAYFTIKLRFDTTFANGSDAAHFYCNYQSVPLAGMIPSISGEF